MAKTDVKIKDYLLEEERLLDCMVRRFVSIGTEEEAERIYTACDRLQGITLKAYKKHQVQLGFYESQKEYLNTYRKYVERHVENKTLA